MHTPQGRAANDTAHTPGLMIKDELPIVTPKNTRSGLSGDLYTETAGFANRPPNFVIFLLKWQAFSYGRLVLKRRTSYNQL